MSVSTSGNPLNGSDSVFNSFQNSFINVVTANAGPWGIPPADLAALVALQAIWVPAYATVSDAMHHTKAEVEYKDQARKNYVAALRPFIQRWIQNNAVMTPADIASTGVKPRDKVRTPAGIPDGAPIIEAVLYPGNQVKLYYEQRQSLPGTTRRAKPYGVGRCEMVYLIGDRPDSPTLCTSTISSSRNPYVLYFDPSQAGGKVWLFARWVNTRGQAGGWSEVFMFVIP